MVSPVNDSVLKPDRPAAAGHKLLGLEVLRFGAALAILFWHYQHFYYRTLTPIDFDRSQQPFYGVFKILYVAGGHGVEVFWCISGFIFFWKYRGLVADRVVGPWKFFVLRFSRLYPLHFATLLLVAALQVAYRAQEGDYFVYQANNLKHFVLQLFFAQGWGLQDDYSFNGPAWSVSIEVLIYLGFFLMLRYVSAAPAVNVVVIALWVAFVIAGGSSLIFDAFAYFYAGGVAALALKQAAAASRTVRDPVIWIGAIVVALMGAVMGLVVLREPRALPLFLLLAVTVLVLVVGSIDVTPRNHRLALGIMALGNLTYGSYLLHFPLQVATMLALSFAGVTAPADQPWFLIGFLAVTLVLSYFAFRLFEMPAQRYIRSRVLG